MLKPNQLPLFPLPLVLFPDGELKLRIFERRYLDMVRDCARTSLPFGVLCVSARKGHETTLCTTGTQAHIVDFYTMDDGLLGITCRGGERFHVRQAHARDSGLLIGDVEVLGAGALVELAPEHAGLRHLLKTLCENLGGVHANPDKMRWDDSDWIANRLAEFFPLELEERQWLLEQPDASLKLKQLLEWLPRFKANED
jgi:hypothetical protein